VENAFLKLRRRRGSDPLREERGVLLGGGACRVHRPVWAENY
jgi:hypothetical protein